MVSYPCGQPRQATGSTLNEGRAVRLVVGVVFLLALACPRVLVWLLSVKPSPEVVILNDNGNDATHPDFQLWAGPCQGECVIQAGEDGGDFCCLHQTLRIFPGMSGSEARTILGKANPTLRMLTGSGRMLLVWFQSKGLVFAIASTGEIIRVKITLCQFPGFGSLYLIRDKGFVSCWGLFWEWGIPLLGPPEATGLAKSGERGTSEENPQGMRTFTK